MPASDFQIFFLMTVMVSKLFWILILTPDRILNIDLNDQIRWKDPTFSLAFLRTPSLSRDPFYTRLFILDESGSYRINIILFRLILTILCICILKGAPRC